MTAAPISKLEYLKKYMSSKNDEKKQKKKKLRQVLRAKSNVTIIDTDVDLKKIKSEGFDEEDEDAPQIVAVISDHDKELQTRKWRTVGSTADRFTVKEEPPSPVSDHSEDQRADSADHSPVRRKRHDSGSDSDHSPISRPQRNFDSDNSPPRKRKDSDSDASPKRKLDRDSDASPPRRNTRKDEDSDASPPRPIRSMVDEDGDLSPTRKSTLATIPPSKIKKEKMDKTLDGKKAGLQSARDLRYESDALRQREDEAFKKLSAKVSGKTAETVHRDRATGKRRNLEAEREADRQKEERKQKMLEKFQEWGKGLKQSQAQEERLHQDIHEMSKPLARMAGDEDLESFLKAKDREGDPMAAYMAKKRKKQETSIPGRPSRPTYQGPDGPPNRFNIPPGYRWDGVDRSNGFEKQWFSKQTKKVAVAEEAYKWSVADM